MEIFSSLEAWVGLLTLTILEIVLGIDNIIFISIVAGKLPEKLQARARNIGLMMALFFRVGLLLSISFIIGLKQPLFTLSDYSFSWRDLILVSGGLFLIAKSTGEINEKMDGGDEQKEVKAKRTLLGAVIQIVLLDIIFSFDSILTAVGLTEEVTIMIAAIIIALIVMMIFAGKISDFINKLPSLQILALSFLILIGFMLVVEALHYHIPKGYIYFAVSFSLIVEAVNIRIRKRNRAKKKAA